MNYTQVEVFFWAAANVGKPVSDPDEDNNDCPERTQVLESMPAFFFLFA